MRRLLLPLCCALALAACSGRPDADARRAEEEALRARVERLEREDAAERQRLAGEVAALRRELEELRSGLDGQGQPAPQGDDRPPAKRSPRQALKQGFHDMVDGARRTLDRLGRELDESLARPDRKKDERPGPAPAPSPVPARPEGGGTQI